MGHLLPCVQFEGHCTVIASASAWQPVHSKPTFIHFASSPNPNPLAPSISFQICRWARKPSSSLGLVFSPWLLAKLWHTNSSHGFGTYLLSNARIDAQSAEPASDPAAVVFFANAIRTTAVRHAKSPQPGAAIMTAPTALDRAWMASACADHRALARDVPTAAVSLLPLLEAVPASVCTCMTLTL